MDEFENPQDLPEFDPVAEDSDFQPEESVYGQPMYEQPVYEVYPPIIEEIYPEEKPQKERKGTKVLITSLSCLLALGIAVTVCSLVALYLQMKWGDEIKRNEQLILQMQQTIEDLRDEVADNSYTGSGNSVSGTPNETADGLTPAQVYAQSVDSVVAVSSKIQGIMPGQQGTSTGSGFLISENGHIVTNYHVIENATSVTVTLYNGKTHAAEIVGYDAENDMAVLKIEAEGLEFLKPGSSEDLIVGDQVVAIGNPLGELTSTMTVGYVSGKDRVVTTDGARLNMIQTDAAINSGNSGGPLLNMKGEVVGITTAKYSGTTSSGASIEGISFAVPMDDVWKKVADLRDLGYITGALLGVTVHEIDQKTATYYGLPMGTYVSEVWEGSAAQKAGIMAKDIITGIGDDPVTSLRELTKALDKRNGGDKTTVTVWRGGYEVTLDVTLDARTPDSE